MLLAPENQDFINQFFQKGLVVSWHNKTMYRASNIYLLNRNSSTIEYNIFIPTTNRSGMISNKNMNLDNVTCTYLKF